MQKTLKQKVPYVSYFITTVGKLTAFSVGFPGKATGLCHMYVKTIGCKHPHNKSYKLGLQNFHVISNASSYFCFLQPFLVIFTTPLSLLVEVRTKHICFLQSTNFTETSVLNYQSLLLAVVTETSGDIETEPSIIFISLSLHHPSLPH